MKNVPRSILQSFNIIESFRVHNMHSIQRICEDEHAQVRGKAGKATEEYTKDMVEVIVQYLMEDTINIKPVRKAMTKEELDNHQITGHDPFDSRCKDCLLGGIKDGPHYTRASDREENTLAIDIAGRFKPGKGEEGGDYKYLLVATFKAARGNWKDTSDEATEETLRTGVEKENRHR